MKVPTINVNTVREYFQAYISAIRTWTDMTPKEASLLATIMEVRHELGLTSNHYKDLVNKNTSAYICEKESISNAYLRVLINMLKKSSIIDKDGLIKAAYLIPYEEEGGVIFSITKKKD